MRSVPVAPLLFLLGCNPQIEPSAPTPTAADTDTDTDADSDTDTDADADSDTDTDTDADTDTPVDTGTPCTDDPLEPVGIETYDNAPDLSAGMGSVTPSDPEDYWVFDAVAGEAYEVTIGHAYADGDIDCDLFGPDQHTILAQGGSVTDDEVMTFTATESGPHYVYLLNLSGTCMDYTLSAVQVN